MTDNESLAELIENPLFREVVNSLEEGFALFDADMQFCYCTQKYFDLIFPVGANFPEPGTHARDLAQLIFDREVLVLPEELEFDDFWRQSTNAAVSQEKGVEFKRSDGRYIACSINQTDNGGYLFTVLDITERKTQDRAKREANQLLEKVIEACPANFLMSRVETGEVLFRSHASQELFGSKDSARSHWSDSNARKTYIKALKTYGRVDDMFVYGSKADGSKFPSQVSARLIEHEGEEVIVSSTTDLTEAFALREQTEEANVRFADALEALDEGLILWDSEWRFVLCNERANDLFFAGSGKPEMGESFRSAAIRQLEAGVHKFPPGYDKHNLAERWVESVKAHRKDLEMHLNDGRIVLASSHRTKLGGFLLTFKEITGERRAEQLLVDAISRLPLGVAVEDPEGMITLCNAAFAELYGLPKEQLIGMPFDQRMEIFYPKVRIMNGVEVTGDPMEFHRKTPASQHDSLVPIEASLRDGRSYLVDRARTGDDGRVVVMTDITFLKEQEQRSLKAVNDAIQALDEALVLFDGDLNFVMGNRRWFDVFFENDRKPELGENATDMVDRMMARNFFKVPDSMTPETYARNMIHNIWHYAQNVLMETQDGRFFTASVHKTGLRGHLIAFTDITEQRTAEMELERQREMTYQNEKLSALGELLAGVAHELNNPLSIVVGYAQMLEGKIDDPTLNRRIERIATAADRSAKIVKTFLAMARQRPTRIEKCFINDVVSMALDISSYGLKTNGTKVMLALDETIPPVSGDADQLAQVFTNLIVNAEHALAAKGEAGQLNLSSFYEAATGSVVVEIRDNGEGIRPELKARIFEPFFTTKDVGIGTGIGLAFSHRIIDTHGGQLTVTSKVGRGTSFFVRLAALQEEDASEVDSAANPCRGKGHKILVVDDEEGVAILVQDLLEEAGLEVIIETDARRALTLLKDENFDVILSDFKMPGLDGQGFLNEISKLGAEFVTRTGFITGDSMSQNVAEFLRKTARPHIEKPIVAEELFTLVENLCTQSGDS